jgi:hypothetical protein
VAYRVSASDMHAIDVEPEPLPTAAGARLKRRAQLLEAGLKLMDFVEVKDTNCGNCGKPVREARPIYIQTGHAPDSGTASRFS